MIEPVDAQILDSRRGAFQWAWVGGLMSLSSCRQLAAATAGLDMVEYRRTDLTKPYRMESAEIWRTGEPLPSQDPWASLIRGLTGAQYAGWLESNFEVDTAGAAAEVVAWRYGTKCFLGPHTDEKRKLLSHVFYLNPSWEPSWGGRLCILDPASRLPLRAISPVAGNSAVLIRSETSWHEVEPVDPSGATRLSVQLVLTHNSPDAPK